MTQILDNKRVSKTKVNWAIALSIIALVFSVPAIFISAPRAYDLNFDYYGVIVGILSLLVTALLGLNIYALIDFNRAKEDMAHNKKELYTIITGNNVSVYHAIADILYSMIDKDVRFSKHEMYVLYRVLELQQMALYGNLEACDIVCTTILKVMPTLQKCGVNDAFKVQIIQILSKISQSDGISAYSDLLRQIIALPLRKLKPQSQSGS